MNRDSGHALSWLMLCLATACSDMADDAQEADGDGAATGADTGGGADAGGGADGAEDTGPVIEAAAWWRLRSHIVVVGGAPQSSGGQLEVSSYDGALNLRCDATASIARVSELVASEPELVVWWQVVAGEWSGTCVDWEQPVPVASVQLGVGEMHPEIIAVLDTVEGASAGSDGSLNGAYARVESAGDIVVFGAAGLPAGFAGTGTPADAAPLADGTWTFAPAYSFTALSGW